MSSRKRATASGLKSKVEIAAALASIKDERQLASATLSGTCRTVALGVLALVWILISGTQAQIEARFSNYSDGLLYLGGVCVLALLLDGFHYVFSLWENDSALKDSTDATSIDDVGYEEKSVLRKLANACFVGKLTVTLIAALWLIGVIGVALNAPRPASSGNQRTVGP